ncbi:DUF4465 domain-containing protein [Parabacteroides sp. OttesenSCG-928-K15]|nr:DUF4465 domain-containing protein [Parabacteroides sp. OttesenSCG-928-K15]
MKKTMLTIGLGLLAISLFSQSPYIYKVYEYMPAPGQFVNELPAYELGDTKNDMRLKAEECLADNEQILVSLGGYGGYIVFGFDHLVKNVPGEYDFKIEANAFYANANPNPETQREGGSAEPGIVMVSYDANGNGKPDDAWYELAGSEYSKAETIKNYRITYFKPDAEKVPTPDKKYPYLSDTTYIRWESNQGDYGYVSHNTFHSQSYYPLWIDADELVFEGTKLADNYIDESGTGSYYVQYAYDWGYVDNHPNSDERSCFNIEWAVDAEGNPVDLPGIHFVKVYTGVNQSCGWLGETSTEILGAQDLHISNTPNDVITLDLTQPTNPAVLETDPEKGHWTQTYSNNYPRIEFGLFQFTHLPGATGGDDVGGGMSYWDGFTYCTSGDRTDYGSLGSSDAWVAQQWGCMAGGGIATDADGNVCIGDNGKAIAQQGLPYLVAYWGYWMETFGGGDPCLQVHFTDGGMYEAVGVYINNHPWAHYGNIHGDGFSRPFDQEGDCFTLSIHGIGADGKDTGIAVEHILAEYKNGELKQSPDWEFVDLSPLGSVSGIYFTMGTSDADLLYGPNTAVYFCLDKLQVREPQQSLAPERPSGLKATAHETTIDLEWNAYSSGAEVKGYNLYLDGRFQAFTADTKYTFTGLHPYTAYTLGVEAVGTDEKRSDKAALSVPTTDETVPSAPSHLTGIATEYTLALSWEAATDNVGVAEYHIYLDGERQRRVTTTSHTLTGLDPATVYWVEVEARDAAGNRSEKTGITLTTDSDDPSATESFDAAETSVRVAEGYLSVENAPAPFARIYAVDGQLRISFAIPADGNAVINISSLPDGVYILRTGNFTTKFIR